MAFQEQFSSHITDRKPQVKFENWPESMQISEGWDARFRPDLIRKVSLTLPPWYEFLKTMKQGTLIIDHQACRQLKVTALASIAHCHKRNTVPPP